MITDPQTQSSYEQADPNGNAVEDTPVSGQDDNRRILPRQIPSGTSRGVQQLGGPSLSADSGNKRITVTDSVPRVLMGDQPTFGEGLYVSKPGKDVTSAQLTEEDFILNSNQNVLKVVLTGTTSITPPDPFIPGGPGKQRVTIPHNLGVAPIPLVFASNPVVLGGTNSGSGLALVPNTLFLTSSYAIVIQSAAFVDTINLYIDLIFLNTGGTNLTGASTSTWNYRYYLLQETAN